MKIKTDIIIIISAVLILSSCGSETDKNFNHKKYSKAELAYYKAELEYMKTRDPKTGKVPDNIRMKELEFSKTIPDKRSFNLNQKNYFPVIQTQDWVSQGPSNIAGRIKAIAFDCKNDKNILAGSASGGLWRSTNSGDIWNKQNSPNSEQSVYCIEQDKREGNTNTWYYGTGELLSTTNRKFAIFPRTVGMGDGIYKSSDNGLTWTQLQSTKVTDKTSLGDVFQAIWEIKVDISIIVKDVVYAACHGAIMKSEDGGESWNLSIGDMQNRCFSTDIEIGTNGMYYSALSTITDNGNKPNRAGIYRSEDGKVWKDITPKAFPDTTRVIKIKLAPSNQNVLYVLTETPIEPIDPFFAFASSHHTFWKYTYNPATGIGEWEDRTQFLPSQDMAKMDYTLQNGYNSLGGYCCVFNVKPDDENTVFLGGTNLFRSLSGFAKQDFKKVGGYNLYLHPDNHSIEFLPVNANILYNGSDGGVAKTINCMSNDVNWDVMNSGLITSQFYSVSIDHANSKDEFLLGGLQDQGTAMIYDNETNFWYPIWGGDGLSSYVAPNKEFIIVSIYDGQIWGGYFDELGQPLIENKLLTSDNMQNAKFNFFTIFDVEPNNNDILFLVAANVIYRKNNLKQAIINTDLRNQNWIRMSASALPVTENITAMKTSAAPANRLYFGSDAGKVYRIDNPNTGNPGFVDISGNEFPQNGYVSCISCDPENADNLFVIFSNYNVQSIFYSSDGGASWVAQGGNLEENPDGGGAGPSIRWIEMLHTDDGIVYFVGTSTGLYSTTSLSGSSTVWLKESDDLIGNIRIDMIQTREIDGFVAIATQGNGIYSCYYQPSTSVNKVLNNNNFSITNYPNPCTNNTTFEFSIPVDGDYFIELFDEKGRLMETISHSYFKEGEHSINFKTSQLQNACYFYRLRGKQVSLSGKMLILR